MDGAFGYKVYWRDTTSPTWDHSRYVGDVSEITLDGIVIDNSFFGVSAHPHDLSSMCRFKWHWRYEASLHGLCEQ